MDYIISFFTGFITAFLGLIAPSMLNMTSAKTSIERGKASGILFALGASTIVIIQVSIAVFFAKYLIAHPTIILRLKIVAIFVLLILSFFFFYQARKGKEIKGKIKQGHSYLIGLGMSSLNMLAIPFYLTMVTLSEKKGWLILKPPHTILYIIGAVLGAFSLFSLYTIFAIKITQRATFIAKNINYILSILFIVLATITLSQIL